MSCHIEDEDTGITPACAGNSFFQTHFARQPQDHPRVCGEQPAGSQYWQRSIGSPPRVRGTATSHGSPLMVTGITPACAGNRPSPATPPLTTLDHPRVCGEQFPRFPSGFATVGSPPRVRGTEPHFHGLLRGHGITPACAGNREFVLTEYKPSKDHPRVCGEQYLWGK